MTTTNIEATNPIYVLEAGTIDKPLWIKSIVFVPGKANDTVTLSTGATSFHFAKLTAATVESYQLTFGEGGIHVPKLIVDVITSGAALYIYL